MAKKVITIEMDGEAIKVRPEKQILMKSQNDEAKWEGKPKDLDFVVRFKNKTPFEHWNFDKSRPESGPIKIEPSGEEEYFEYSVEVGKKVQDPGIIIRD